MVSFIKTWYNAFHIIIKEMLMLLETEKSYIAGLVDGEGCIYIDKYKDKRNKSGNYNYCLRVSIANTFFGLMEWLGNKLSKEYHNHVLNQKGKEYINGRKPCYVWKICGTNAINFLKEIYPYLIIKKKQCEKAFEFSETHFDNAKRDRKGKFSKLPNELLEKKEKIHKEIKDLNQRREM